MEAGAAWTEPGGLQEVEGINLSENVYFGWAPITTSETGTLNASELKIEQNGVDIVADTPIEYKVDPPSVFDPLATPLPVTSGLRARYNATSWQSTTVWEDLSGNNRHMQNASAGPSEFVSVENANMTENTTGGRFAYIRGDQNSRWNVGGTGNLPVNSWTVIHISRYDPVYSDKVGRILSGVGANVVMGTWNGYTGGSLRGNAWIGLSLIHI